MSEETKIYHNPLWGTSCTVPGPIRSSSEKLITLIASMGLPAREVLLVENAPYEERGLGDSKWSDKELIDSMLQHPVLVNPPIVGTGLGTRLRRPSESVFSVLSQPQRSAFAKKDSPVVVDAGVEHV